MNNATPAQTDARKRNRNALLLIAAMIFGSFLVAGALRFSGWRPEGMKNRGELLQPPGDLRRLHPQWLDGGEYEWNPAGRHWRILVAAPRDCAARCDRLAEDLDKIWQIAGRDADRLEIVWLGQVPASAPTANRHGSVML